MWTPKHECHLCVRPWSFCPCVIPRLALSNWIPRETSMLLYAVGCNRVPKVNWTLSKSNESFTGSYLIFSWEGVSLCESPLILWFHTFALLTKLWLDHWSAVPIREMVQRVPVRQYHSVQWHNFFFFLILLLPETNGTVK